ncbi:hypothetical protein LJC46_05830 [Desulfovibrio sp. OttesenSCG-928-G15]|nr:hypothetical protein [Desulfovibrio sp. OttesenSCG-928-G15]
MKQKIEWYREVLDLEPGSRVFFPLAKLLAANGQTSDAISTLRQGLLRHPDNVEARLLLVELLYLQDDDAGVQSEINHLGGTFSLYPVFWKAWSDKLSENPDSHDASLALRFFAAALQGKTVNWADVVVQGLRAVLHDAENSPAPRRAGSVVTMDDTKPSEESPLGGADAAHAQQGELDEQPFETLAGESPEAPSVVGVPVAGVPVADTPADISDDFSDEMVEDFAGTDAELSPDDVMLETPDAPEASDAAASPDAFALDACEDLSPDDELPSDTSSTDAFASGEDTDLSPDDMGMDFLEESAAAPGFDAGPSSKEGADAALDDILPGELPERMPETATDVMAAVSTEAPPSPAPADAFLNAEADSGQFTAPSEEGLTALGEEDPAGEALALSQDAHAAEDGDDSASDDEEEAFSLRTRSMAEVLAEQGDIAGALDIYHELLASSGDEERPVLEQRAEELQQRLESPASAEHKAEERAVQPGTESTRLVNLLESLAQRLEDRAR